ncbi:MAG: ExbD/TolR family protein [Puniceicoccaceae bacterium]
MSSQRHIKKGSKDTDINISPMIDMVFILLIFFIVTTVFVEEAGIKVSKPDIDPGKTTEVDPISLKVTVSNQVYFNGDLVPINRVEGLVSGALSQNPEQPVIMQVERNALSGTMIQVMDSAKLGGADKISVTAVDTRG